MIGLIGPGKAYVTKPHILCNLDTRRFKQVCAVKKFPSAAAGRQGKSFLIATRRRDIEASDQKGDAPSEGWPAVLFLGQQERVLQVARHCLICLHDINMILPTA
jgi:hypothetical protein